MASYQAYWDKMSERFSEMTGRPNSGLGCTYHIAVVAILWQDTLIKTRDGLKFLSAVLIDEESYRRTWDGYRRLWNIKATPKHKARPEWLQKPHTKTTR